MTRTLVPISCTGSQRAQEHPVDATVPVPSVPAASPVPPAPLTRAQLLSRGAKGGAALLVGAAALGPLTEAARSEPLSDGDLAYARLLVGIELLSIDFYTRAVAAKRFRPHQQKKLREALAHEQAHYQSVGQILVGAGLVPASAPDIDFTYPRGTFAKPGPIAKLGFRLETLSVGAYLGAVSNLQSAPLVPHVARIGASEAQHLSAFGTTLRRPFGFAFPAPLPIEEISASLDAYMS